MVTVVEPISPRHRQHRTAGNSFAQRNRRLSDDWFIGHCSPAIERSAGTDYAWNILYQGDLFNAVAATYNTPNGVFNPGQDSMLAPNPGMQMVGLSAYSQPQGFWGFYAQHEQGIQTGVAVTAGLAASLASFGILAPEAGAGIAAVIAAQAASGAAGGFTTGYLESGFNGGWFTQNLEAGTINGGIGAALGGGFGAAGGLVGNLLGRSAADVGFIGPTIGRSGFQNVGEFSDAVAAKYQQLYDQGYQITMRRVAQGLVANDPAAVGSEVDQFARERLRDWLDAEGIGEGPGRLIQINRRIYDPTGSGLYRIPDVYIPAAQSILDGTVALKTAATSQIHDFWSFSNGANITIIRPISLITNGAQGSYGIIQ